MMNEISNRLKKVILYRNKTVIEMKITKVERIRSKCHQYTKKQPQKIFTHIAYLVLDGETFAGAGGVSFFEVMPTFHNPTGKKAYIMNMYTKPEYRRQGIAYQTLDLLVTEAKAREITEISLEATQMGRGLYEKYGFVSMKDEMELLK